MKKKILIFICSILGVILLLFSIRVIFVLLNIKEVKDNAYTYQKVIASYAEIGYKAARNPKVITKKTLKILENDFRNALSKVAIENESFMSECETHKSILKDYLKTGRYDECEKTDFIITKVRFNLDCTEAIVNIDDNFEVIQYRMDDKTRYILESRSPHELVLIKQDDTWKVKSWDMLDLSSNMKDLNGNPIVDD